MINYSDCEIQLFEDEGMPLTPKIIANVSLSNRYNCFQIEMELMPFCPEQENGIYFFNQVFKSKEKCWIYIDNYSCSNVVYNLMFKAMSIDTQGSDLIYSYFIAGL